MNELLFLLHIISVVIFTLGALRLGRSALVSCVALQAVFANLFVLKQMTLFGFNVTCSDVFAVGGVLGLNLLNEYFGKKTARDTVWISFGAMVFFGMMSQIHLFYVPNQFDSAHIHFLNLLSPVPRILVASFTAYFISTRFDVWFYDMLKKVITSLAIRSGVSLIITQSLDTVLFGVLGLYGIVYSVIDIIVVSLVIKLIVISIAVPFSTLSKKIVGPSE